MRIPNVPTLLALAALTVLAAWLAIDHADTAAPFGLVTVSCAPIPLLPPAQQGWRRRT